MPSIRQILGAVLVGCVVSAIALPTEAKHEYTLEEKRAYRYGQLARKQILEERQNPATGLPDGLTDIDILVFALTLEHLETAFYQQGFSKFQDTAFTALGLTPEDIKNLKSIGGTEATHVSTLISAINGAGTAPVAACTYNFEAALADANAMVATAAILENIGVSAYMAAAPLLKSPEILSVAASIVTVEARHQTFIRVALGTAAIPSAFDTPLGVRAVFTLATTFITSCPTGSNLAIQPFPALTMATAAAAPASPIAAGTPIAVTTTASGGSACAFLNGGLPGGAAFTTFSNGTCTVPKGLAGVSYLHLASATPADGVLTDAITVAGPMVLVVS